MRLYLLAILILILSYFQVTKNLQLSFFNSFSPAILFFKEFSIDLKEISLIIFNLDGIRQENRKLKKIIGELEGNKDKETLLNLNSLEFSALESDFKTSQILKNKNISIKN